MDTTAPAGMGECTSPPQWFVIRTQAQAELTAARELARDGFEVFAPRVTTARAHGGPVEAPLFPGYLFLRCEPAQVGQYAFRPGHRIAGWVNFSGVVPPVPNEVISELQQRVSRIERDGGMWRRFKPGETVNLVAGNLETLAEVVAEAKSPEGRVKVLLNFMGRLVEAQVPRQRLWPAQGASPEPVRFPRRTRGRGRWIRGFEPRLVESA